MTVSFALSLDVKALPHIIEAVNDLLMPLTIDSAVYYDLKRVVQIHGASRSWTVKAMDGAAVNGRLDIMQWLRDNRTEGCSEEAFIAAAKNGDIEMVKWLYEFYLDVCHPVEAMMMAAENGQAMMMAAENGQAEVVRFLRTFVAMNDAVPALEDAVVNGRVEVVDALVPYYSGLAQGAFMVASAHGQSEVVRLLLNQGFTSVMYTNPSLREAAEGGHIDLVDLLLEFCGDDALADALEAAVGNNRYDILQLIVERRQPKDIGAALEQAALENRVDMVKFLLENCPDEDESYISRSSAFSGGDADLSMRDSTAANSLKIAVHTNNFAMAKLFVMKSNPVGRVDALVTAVAEEKVDMVRSLVENGDLRMIEQALVKISSVGNHAMAKKLLERCDPASCKRVFENAATNGAVELVQEMLEQMDERSAGDALRFAAMNGHTDVVKVLLLKSDAAGVASAFNVAAMQGRLAVVELLSERE
ncbi:Hypothetical protein PHPALM_17203 [Phytophthora palmivora]|uniref:Uncharacterized protein n=1 Tax=Phytophthora palmivora TaxID=4796 RepID=A0A2P4XMT3_9STRA|nr:Hypothetical protein PHPALM_17203 [Phytophthora palmivora]